MYSGSYFGDGIYPIVFSNMQCIGPEDDLINCPKDQYLTFTCPRSQVAGVLCGYGTLNCMMINLTMKAHDTYFKTIGFCVFRL